jgi:hypothetical protein
MTMTAEEARTDAEDRRIGREKAARMAAATRLSPPALEALREDKRQATATAREWLASRKAEKAAEGQ